MRDEATREGLDTDLAWNDSHLQFVWLWLTMNDNSPFKGAPALVLGAMDVDRAFWKNLKKQLTAGKLYVRFSVRVRLTAKFKVILSGQFTGRIDKRDTLGRVRKYTILPVADPRPLPIPPWIKGSVRLTREGLQCLVRESAASFAPRHDAQGKERLTNPFGRR